MSSRDGKLGRRPRALRLLGGVLYWIAVVAISLAVVIALVLMLESLDASSLGGP